MSHPSSHDQDPPVSAYVLDDERERRRKIHDAIGEQMRVYARYILDNDLEDDEDGDEGDYVYDPNVPSLDVLNVLRLLPSFQTAADSSDMVKQLRATADFIERVGLLWESRADHDRRVERERAAPTS